MTDDKELMLYKVENSSTGTSETVSVLPLTGEMDDDLYDELVPLLGELSLGQEVSIKRIK